MPTTKGHRAAAVTGIGLFIIAAAYRRSYRIGIPWPFTADADKLYHVSKAVKRPRHGSRTLPLACSRL
ncbi:MAG: hypothetical protein NZ703_02400 [Gemmataceae bacterium]|nr:hypothetical protein [Gemmataceae bacterium]MCS7269911.1 hypothetical protein [Gemmataceae bacterium]MDW8244100.1 hypothetical protein [Thermogemmata sp.]